MTVQQILEDIMVHFPNVGETEAKLEINRVYKEFCSESRVLTASANLTLTTAVTYSLPSAVDKVYRVDQFDSAGKPIETYDRLEYKIEHGSIKFYDKDGETITTWPSSVATVTLNYYKIPTTLSTLSSTLEISSKYDEYIIAGVLKKLYAKYPNTQIPAEEGRIIQARDWNAVKYWSGEYQKGIILAKREAHRQQDETPWEVALQDFNINENA